MKTTLIQKGTGLTQDACNQKLAPGPLKLLLGLLGGLFLLGLGALALVGGLYALISGLRM